MIRIYLKILCIATAFNLIGIDMCAASQTQSKTPQSFLKTHSPWIAIVGLLGCGIAYKLFSKKPAAKYPKKEQEHEAKFEWSDYEESKKSTDSSTWHPEDIAEEVAKKATEPNEEELRQQKENREQEEQRQREREERNRKQEEQRRFWDELNRQEEEQRRQREEEGKRFWDEFNRKQEERRQQQERKNRKKEERRRQQEEQRQREREELNRRQKEQEERYRKAREERNRRQEEQEERYRKVHEEAKKAREEWDAFMRNSYYSSSSSSYGHSSHSVPLPTTLPPDLQQLYREVGIPEGQTPFQVLGVANNASEAEIDAAFKPLARQWHPDKHVNDTEVEKQRVIAHFKLYSVCRDRCIKIVRGEIIL